MERPYWISTTGVLVILAGVLLLVYWEGMESAFQYDDIHSLVENPHIRSWENIPAFFYRPELFSSASESAMYRPLVLVSYALNYALGGYRVGGYHWFNLSIHIGSSFLVYLLLCCYSDTRLRAFLGACIFALHPVNSETVNYICSRSESLCAFFFLASFYFYLKGSQGHEYSSRWLVGSIVAFCGALLTKSIAIMLIGLLFVFELISGGERKPIAIWKQIAQRQWPFWIVSGGYLAITGQLVEKALISQPVRGMDTQLWTQTKGVIYYLKLLAMPVGLNVEHQFRLGEDFWDLQVLFPVLFLLSLAIIIWKNWEVLASHRFWIVWPFVILLPTLVIPLNVLINEHRLFLPSLAFAALVVKLPNRYRGVMGWGGIGLLLIYGVLDHQRTEIWKTPQTLWQDSLNKSPLMPRPHIFMGDNFKILGEHELALQEYRKALEVYPQILSGGDRLVIHNNMGATYLAMGRFVEAIDAYQRALQVDSTYVKAREGLEGVLALKETERDPRAEKLRKLGLNWMIVGDLEKAIAHLKEALELQSDPQTWMGLGVALERKEDWEGAIRVYEVLRIVGEGRGYEAAAEEKIRVLSGRL